MTLLPTTLNRNMLGLVVIMSLAASFLLPALLINPVSASPGLELKWSKSLGQFAKTYIAPLAANLVGDSRPEIVVVGGSADYGNDGTVTVLDGTTGNVIWQVAPYSNGWGGVGMHTPFEINDLNNDGALEIIIASTRGAMALHGNDGSLYWISRIAPAEENYLAVADIDGNGYSEVFVSRGYGPYDGYDWTTSLSYEGRILNQAWTWHPCWGGLTVGDTNLDGIFELYQGDRSSTYVGYRNGVPDPYKGGGMGIRAFDAKTLRPLWNDPSILCSSHAPMLADVDKDGILDVIVGDQISQGIAVLNSADGSVVTTGGKYRKGGTSMPVHSQPTAYDVDGDGNLEFISARSSQPKIWDLYSWKLDATLPIATVEPPKLADVTGDGKMDIIAVTSSTRDLYIYTYDSTSATYKEMQHVADYRLVNANAFTLVQDIDGDNLNELVLTGSDGRVTAFETPAPAPTPRARTTNHFYSERRLGAAEYVGPPSSRLFSPPTHTDPILISSSGTNTGDENLIAKNQTTFDSDGDKVTNVYNWYVDNLPLASLLLPFDTRPTRAGTVLNDGFEYGFNSWDGNGITDWDRSTAQKHSGQYSAHAGDADNYLTSDSVDASGAASITISFWYRDHGIDDDDNVYLQFYNGSSDPSPYNNVFELGNTSPEDTWHYYSVWFRTILWYRISDFRIRIDARSIDAGEDLWIDDVVIALGDALTTRDYSGYNNQGTIRGAAWKRNGVVGGAYYFNGAGYIYVPHSNSLDGGGSWTQMTVESWIKPTASKRGSTIIAKNLAGGYASYMMGFETSKRKPLNTLFWGIQNPTWKEIEYSTPLSTNIWYHVVGTYKSGVGLTLYVNGAKVAQSVSLSGNIAVSSLKSLYIGWDGATGSKYFTGMIDDVRIYPRSLSSQQVLQRYIESKSSRSNESIMVSQETTVGDVWKCEVTPSDSFLDGITRTSDTLTVLPSLRTTDKP